MRSYLLKYETENSKTRELQAKTDANEEEEEDHHLSQEWLQYMTEEIQVEFICNQGVGYTCASITTYNLTDFYEESMEIQLSFNNMTLVSQDVDSLKDVLKVTLNTEFLYDASTSQQILEPYTIQS